MEQCIELSLRCSGPACEWYLNISYLYLQVVNVVEQIRTSYFLKGIV